MSHSYFDEYDEDGNKKEDNAIPAELKEELSNNQAILPENTMFEGKINEEEKEAVAPKIFVAIKKQKDIIDLNGLNFSLLREIKLLQELNHPNIVKLHDVFHLKNLLYFALEYGPIDLEVLMFKERSNIVLEA
jgi:serine/threonine protein kinase